MGLASLITNGVEAFDGSSKNPAVRDEKLVSFLGYLLGLVIALALIGFFGKWLWNYSIVNLVSVAKPVKSVWEIIALFFFLLLVAP